MTFDTHSKQGGFSVHVLVHEPVTGRFANSEGINPSSTQMGHSLVSSPEVSTYLAWEKLNQW